MEVAAVQSGFKALDRRLRALEAALALDAGDADRVLSEAQTDGALTTCRAHLDQMEHTVALLVKENDGIAAVVARTADLDRLPSETSDPGALDDASKAEIVLASEHGVRTTGKLLEEIDALKGAINPPESEAVDQIVVALTEVEANVHSQQMKAQSVQRQVDALLSSFGGAMHAVSQQFVAWDTMLSTLEQRVESIAAAARERRS
eukprot:Opistho-2@26029